MANYLDSREFILLDQRIDVNLFWAGGSAPNQMTLNGIVTNLWNYLPSGGPIHWPLLQGSKPLYLWSWFEQNVSPVEDFYFDAVKDAGHMHWLFDQNGPLTTAGPYTFMIYMGHRVISNVDKYYLVCYDLGHSRDYQYLDTDYRWCEHFIDMQIQNLLYQGYDPTGPLTRNDRAAATAWLLVPQAKWRPDLTNYTPVDETYVYIMINGALSAGQLGDDGVKYTDLSNILDTSPKVAGVVNNIYDPLTPATAVLNGNRGYYPGPPQNQLETLTYKYYRFTDYYNQASNISWHNSNTLPMTAYTIETSGEDTEPDDTEVGGDGEYVQDDTDQTVSDNPGDDGQHHDPGEGEDPGDKGNNISGGGANATGMVHLYAPTYGQMKVFAQQMWDDNFLTQIKKMFTGDPIQSIISLAYFPIDLSPYRAQNATNCIVGVYDTQCPMFYLINNNNNVKGDYLQLFCGHVDVSEKWGAAIDYDPYSTAEVYLPFIGFVKVSMSDILSAKGKDVPCRVKLWYNINLFTGDCVAQLYAASVSQTPDSDAVQHLIGQWGGNCAEQIPFTGVNYANYYKNLGSTLMSAGTAIGAAYSGNFLLSGTAAASSVMNTMSCPPQVNRSGSFTGGAARIQKLKPFIRLVRPAQSLAQKESDSPDVDGPGYKSFEGRSCNYYVEQLSSKSGFTMVKSIKLNGIGATEDEMKEIDSLLKQGVFI